MKAFDSGRWLRASRHLDRVLDLPAAERERRAWNPSALKIPTLPPMWR